MIALSATLRILGCAAVLVAPGAASAQLAGNHIDITAVTIEAATAQECQASSAHMAEHSRALSLATTPPYDLAPGLRTFYDHVLRLDPNGELSSTAQLSTVYTIGYDAAGEPVQRVLSPFVRVEVARPAGTPNDAPSRISISWLWLQRLSRATDPGGRLIERPALHRFDFVGEVDTTYGTWGTDVAPCRAGSDGRWVGAVTVWTYLPP